MAQVKLLKINSDGFTEEHGSADDATFSTVTGATSVGVTSGVTLTNNITFNAVSDTIAGIENQNLLDKTATETISGQYTIDSGVTLTLTDSPVADTDAANKGYVDSVAQGLSWQEPIIDKDLTAPPGGETTGDRYIVGGSATGDWAGQDNNIAEWNGASWDFTTAVEGFATWAEDEDKQYVFNGTSWTPLSSTQDHNNLANLQGGTTAEYYHMTAAEDTWLNTVSTEVDAANVLDKTAAETISGDFTFTGTSTFTNGDVVLPSAAMGTPVEGSVYYDGTSDILYVYDGASYVDVSSAGSADSVKVQYTAGTGGIAQYDAVYISGADTVLKADATVFSTSKVIGFAPNAIGATSSGDILVAGVLTGVLTGATAGDAYYLSETAGLVSTTKPTTSGSVVYRVGYAKNATDLQLDLEFVGIRS